MPFHQAQDLGKEPKKLAGRPAADLGEAFYTRLLDVMGPFIISESYLNL